LTRTTPASIVLPMPKISWMLLFLLFAWAITPIAKGEVYEETSKKHSWFSWNRPAKKNPFDQLKHAERLVKQGEYKKAAKALRALAITWPGSAEAPVAQWSLARVLDKTGKYEDAFEAYQKLFDHYPGLFPNYDEILNRQFEIAKTLMATRKGKFFIFPGFDAPERAIPFFEKVTRNGPRSTHAAEAQYLIGVAHEKNFDYDLAVVAYIATLHRYPESPFAELAAFGRARALHSIHKDYPNDQQALEDAWAGVMVFLRAYPQSDMAAEATAMRDTLLQRMMQNAFNLAEYYEKIAKKPKAAQLSYEQFLQHYPRSELAPVAKQRLDELSRMNETTKENANETP
jgi:outer membrane protein assembly factor BamD (BamD/ComL family)